MLAKAALATFAPPYWRAAVSLAMANGETFGGHGGKSWRLRRSLDLFCFSCSNSHWVCNGRRACDVRMDELSTRFTVHDLNLKIVLEKHYSNTCTNKNDILSFISF